MRAKNKLSSIKTGTLVSPLIIYGKKINTRTKNFKKLKALNIIMDFTTFFSTKKKHCFQFEFDKTYISIKRVQPNEKKNVYIKSN